MGEVVASFFSRLASMERICVGWSGRRMGHPGTGNEEETWVGLAGNRRNGQVRTTACQGDGTAGRKKPVGLFRYGHPRCEKKPVPQGCGARNLREQLSRNRQSIHVAFS